MRSFLIFLSIQWLLPLFIICDSMIFRLGCLISIPLCFHLCLVDFICNFSFLSLVIILYNGPNEVIEDWRRDLFRLSSVSRAHSLWSLFFLVLFTCWRIFLCLLWFLRPYNLYSINNRRGISLRMSIRCCFLPLLNIGLFGRLSFLLCWFLILLLIIICQGVLMMLSKFFRLLYMYARLLI